MTLYDLYFIFLYLILCILNLIRTLIFDPYCSPKYHKIVLVLHTHISRATRMSYECLRP